MHQNYNQHHNYHHQRRYHQQQAAQQENITRVMGICDEENSLSTMINSSRRYLSTKTVKSNQIALSSNMRCQLSKRRFASVHSLTLIMMGLLLVMGPSSSFQLDDSSAAHPAPKSAAPAHVNDQQQPGIRSTQPTVDRQVDTPNSSPVNSVSQAPSSKDQQHPAAPKSHASDSAIKPSSKPTVARQVSASQRKSALASFQNYDKYQLKATNSHNTTPVMPDPSSTVAAAALSNAAAAASNSEQSSSGGDLSKFDEPVERNKVVGSNGSGGLAHKKSSHNVAGKPKSTSFSLLKKFLPSFMTSAGPITAAAAAASAVVDKHQVSHSRSSQSLMASDGGVLSKASGKIINLLSSKKSAAGGLVPDHAPFFVRKPSIDRQAGFASGLLSNPLGLGLLFSAPLIPSLLLTPLAIAGLSPAMSAINNFFGDDEEASTPASSPLSVLTGGSSPLSSILQGSSGSGSAPTSSLALQAMQSFLGPPATTEKPLFNPGMFASQGIQNAMGSLSSSSSTGGSGSSSSSNSPGSSLLSGGSGSTSGSTSSSSSSPIRNFLGGNFIQTAASMISPSFAAPPSSSSSSPGSSSNSDSDDGPGFMQVASDVFDKVANYMNPDRDVAQAASTSSLSTASGSASSSSSPSASSPLSALVGLSNFSPFQLSSLFASSPLASAISPASGSSSAGAGTGGSTQRAGFFSTLKNVYELFSSSFLRRQEIGDSNECQQRLICELHQRAMNSKLFRRSVQANLMELAQLDRSLQEQIKINPLEARVDADTKAMLSDFLKATNNFKNGRELINCSKMFPKCSRTMLLSAANAHLTDPANSKAIGTFSNLMKKMKFKSAQQHQSQWKLRKPSKTPAMIQLPRSIPAIGSQYQASDYLQVAPMSTIPGAIGKQQPGQLTPADSLKLVQQIMLMSQQQQQQTSQIQPMTSYANNQQVSMQPTYGQQQSQIYGQALPAVSYQNYAQYQQGPQQQISNTYADAIQPVYSSTTDSPYFAMQSHQQQQQVSPSDLTQPREAQPMMQQQSNQQQVFAPQQQQQLLSNYQQYPMPTSTMPEHIAASTIADKKVQQQPGVIKATST